MEEQHSTIKIAIIDDDKLITVLLQDYLEQTTTIEPIFIANSGSEFLEKLEDHSQHPDVILLDLRMENGSGLDILNELSKREVDFKIIVMSSHYNPAYTGQMLKFGCDAFLPKEIDPEELVEIIEKVYQYGRITWMIRRYDIGKSTQTDKLWMYTYDIRGNVDEVVYQPNTPSEYFRHRYVYDADNRLLEVFTSDDASAGGIKQVNYIYYAHGPLKRVELREGLKLQGIDYVYTINGALKSINNPNPNYDPGQDGIANSFNPDQFAMTLDYFAGDYKRNGTEISNVKADNWNPNTPSILESNYSGSIMAQHWNRKPISGAMDQYQDSYIYKYDAFNHLNTAIYGSFKPKPVGTVQDNILTTSNNYKVSDVTYDKNGNLETLKRRNSTGGLEDDLAYSYKLDLNTGQRTNKLDKVEGAELQSQSGNNYRYDASGRLVEDVKEKLLYEYNTQGLVTGVKSTSITQSGYYLVKFYYDDSGFRYKKEEFDSNEDVNKTTLYVRDLSGQVASIYTKPNNTYVQKEIPFYGNSRIGIFINGNEYHYELKDHLGNVRETIKVISNTPTWADSKSDYYPFGMKLMNPNSNINSYRYGYQGEYAEDETEENGIKSNSFQLRLYNPRLGRWLSPDPYGQYHSPYLAMGNSPTIRLTLTGDTLSFGLG